MFLSDWDTWWHTHTHTPYKHTCNGPATSSHILPCTRSRSHCNPSQYWLSEGWRLTCQVIGGMIDDNDLSVSLSAGSWLVNRWHTRSSAACSGTAGPERACYWQLHPAACCYLGWLTNNAERQREVCLHHVLQLIFSLIRRHSDTVKGFWMRTCCSLGQCGTFLRSVMERGADLTLCWASWLKIRCLLDTEVMETVVLWRAGYIIDQLSVESCFCLRIFDNQSSKQWSISFLTINKLIH